MRVAVDVGGTFTDLVALDDATGTMVRVKVQSTPRAPQDGVFRALEALAERSSQPISLVAHSSTVATNALLGQMSLELPRVAFLTTEGFRDLVEIGRQNRSEVYNLFVTRPVPLARREDRLTVRERIDGDGSIAVALDDASVDAAVAALRNSGVRNVAIGLLNAYVNETHELALESALARALPGVRISRSSGVDPEYREYERFSTTLVNAVLLPIVETYLDALAGGARERGIGAPIFVMQSGGGMAAIEAAARSPMTLIESGPASGVIAAAYLGRALGIQNILSFDMGGTTAKAGTIVGGAPEVAYEFEAAGVTHSGRTVKGSGYPVRAPFVDLAEVSAGGGTIAWLDDAGALRVGPLSAGADPGPAAYGRSDRPTVTDANIVLGRLNPQALLGGAFPVDAQRARSAVAAVAAPLGGDVEQAAAGIIALIDAEMAKVLRIVSVERGYDPRDFTLMAFGGNGPLHACALASELGIKRIVVPPSPGLFSAYGLLAADVRVTRTRSIVAPSDEATHALVAAAFDELGADALAALREQSGGQGEERLERELDMRYAGQSFELTIPAPERLADARDAFHARHQARYGYAARADEVEIVAARVIACATTPKPRLERQRSDDGGVFTPAAQRDVWHRSSGFTATPVYDRGGLPGDARIAGPAIVEQYDSCTYVASEYELHVDETGDLIMEHK